MARAGLADILDALADQIRHVLEATTDVAVQVEPRRVVNPTLPTVDMYFGAPSRDQASAAFDDISGAYLITVRARVGLADSRAGLDLLVAFADDTSDLCLAQAIMDEHTLNGYAGSLDVRDFSGERVYEEGEALGFEFTVIVIPAES